MEKEDKQLFVWRFIVIICLLSLEIPPLPSINDQGDNLRNIFVVKIPKVHHSRENGGKLILLQKSAGILYEDYIKKELFQIDFLWIFLH